MPARKAYEVKKSEATRLATIMREEVLRAMTQIHFSGHPKPFYISFLVRDEDVRQIKASYGSLSVDSEERKRTGFCDVRVGSYHHDQVQDGGLYDNSQDDDSYSYIDLPFGQRDSGIRHGLWRQAEVRYREAVEAYATKKSYELTYVDRNRNLLSLQKASAIEDIHWTKSPAVDSTYWSRFVEMTSLIVRDFPEVKESHVLFKSHNRVHVFVNSEGRLIVQCLPLWSVSCFLWLLPPSGDALSWTINHFSTRPTDLPDVRAFRREIRETVAKLKSLAQAPALRSYSGPVLLDPIPAGLLIHEALGHRLEGNRMLCTGEGQTFRDSVNQNILPPYLSIEDDPNLKDFQGRSLVGHYLYDDEGIAGEKTKLVEHGILKNFLTSRAGISTRHRSNGHGRNERHERTISRMAVTRVISENGKSDAEMKQALIEEVQRQNLPYGIRILSATGGETATESYNFQAFLGEINMAARIYPDGREELVRGVDFVGTPLNATRTVAAAGNRYEVDNAYCGAESGWVPVSTISPSLLITHLELQAKSDPPYSQPCYPIPWKVPSQ
jgi:TldD protein